MSTARSQNGYPVIAEVDYTGPLPRLRKGIIPGVAGRHIILRDGSAAFLLLHFAMWYHQRIEPLNVGQWDDWGWAVRSVRGSSSISNHASGTAMDLNATKHPLGASGTLRFKVRGRVALFMIKRRLRLYEGVIRSGAFYSGRKDEMHYELNKPLGEAERVARKLLNTRRGKRVLKANPGLRAVVLS